MKFLLLLFFAFGTCATLFLATIMYGGVSRVTIKKALAESTVYTKISDHFASADQKAADQEGSFPMYFTKLLTPNYIQTKSESVLDSSLDWITGKTQTVPVVSFAELKEEMQASRPDLLYQIQHVPSDETLAGAGFSEEEQTLYINQAKQLNEFVKNDFTINLSQYLESLKIVYTGLQIAVPVLAIILLFTFLMILKLSAGLHAKLVWTGLTLLAASLAGFGCLFIYAFTKTYLSQINLLDQSDLIALSSPIIITILTHFFAEYSSFQQSASIVMLLAACFLLFGAKLIRNKEKKLQPLNIQKSYWRQPSGKKRN